MSDRVKLDVNERIAHVRMNRPEKKNALDGPMFDGLLAAARRLGEDASVRAVVLSGEGDSFCSGLESAKRRSAQSRSLSRAEGRPIR